MRDFFPFFKPASSVRLVIPNFSRLCRVLRSHSLPCKQFELKSRDRGALLSKYRRLKSLLVSSMSFLTATDQEGNLLHIHSFNAFHSDRIFLVDLTKSPGVRRYEIGLNQLRIAPTPERGSNGHKPPNLHISKKMTYPAKKHRGNKRKVEATAGSQIKGIPQAAIPNKSDRPKCGKWLGDSFSISTTCFLCVSVLPRSRLFFFALGSEGTIEAAGIPFLLNTIPFHCRFRISLEHSSVGATMEKLRYTNPQVGNPP